MNIVTEVMIELYTIHGVSVDSNDIRQVMIVEEDWTKEELIRYFIDRDRLFKSIVSVRQ